MVKEANYEKATKLEIIFFVLMSALILGFTLFIGLSLKGFEESFVSGKPLEFGSYLINLLIYTIFALVTVLTIIIFPLTKLWTLNNKHPALAPNPNWTRFFAVSYVHSPEENGLLPRTFPKAFAWLKNPILTLWVFLLFFGLFGLLLIGNPQVAVSGVPQLNIQQVTAISEVGFGALLPAWTENGVALLFFMVLMGAVAFLSAKLRFKNLSLFFGLGFLVCILIGIIWASFHILVYGNSDASYWGTFIFGFMGSFITLLTGSMIPWFCFHLMNNLGLVLLNYVAVKEDLFLVFGLIWFILTVLTIFIWRNKKKKNKLVYGIPT